MGWAEYYKRENPTVLLSSNLQYYEAAARRFQTKHGYLPSGQSATFLLAGFYPNDPLDPPASFVRFCRNLHSHPQDRYLIIDKNTLPLERHRHRTDLPNTAFQQCPFESLDLPPDSLNLILADFTLNFMDRSQVRRLSSTLARTLSADGIFLAMTKQPLVPFFEPVVGFLKNKVAFHHWNSRNLQENMPDLKLTYSAACTSSCDYDLYAFARQDSPFPNFGNQPQYLLGHNSFESPLPLAPTSLPQPR